jgi:Ni/Co efflux regulator RcnB
MRKLCIIATMTAVLASPACAQSARNAQAQHRAQWQDRPQDRSTSHDVQSGDRYLGRDPDPNIRFDLLREQNWRKGG